jgi:hypothetical protein
VMAAWLERDVEGAALQPRAAGGLNRLDLGVWRPQGPVKTLPQSFAVSTHDGSDQRVGADVAAASLGEFHRAYEILVIALGNGRHAGALRIGPSQRAGALAATRHSPAHRWATLPEHLPPVKR